MRELTKVCDVCGKPTKKIVGKIHFIPAGNGSPVRHSNYTHHADVGSCCHKKLLSGLRWRKRVTAEVYQKSRRVG